MRVDVCLLTGRRLELTLGDGATVADAKVAAEGACGVPAACQALFSPPALLDDSAELGEGATVHMVLRMCAGKGGFGKNLRAAGRKGPSQRAPNYNACRDLSGRRVRHVNQEKMMDAHNDGRSVADAVIIGTAELTKKQQMQIQRRQKFKEQRLKREAEWAGQKRSKDDIYKEDVQNKLKAAEALTSATQTAFKDGLSNAAKLAAGTERESSSDESSSGGEGADTASAAPSAATAASAASSKRRRLMDFSSDSDSGSGSDAGGAASSSSSHLAAPNAAKGAAAAAPSMPVAERASIATSVAKSKLGL